MRTAMRQFRRRVVVSGLVLAAFGVTYTTGQLVVGAPTENHTTISKSESLIRQHDCWKQAAPSDMAGKFPGHVVVTLPSGRVVYGGARMVGRALNHVFDGTEPDLHVHAFCR